jgi:hypothetical protein
MIFIWRITASRGLVSISGSSCGGKESKKALRGGREGKISVRMNELDKFYNAIGRVPAGQIVISVGMTSSTRLRIH